MDEMDRALHGQTDTILGDQEFKVSLELLNKVFDYATAKYPEQSLRFHFETRPKTPFMYIFAEPVTEVDINDIQNTNRQNIEQYERSILGLADKKQGPVAGGRDNGWRDIRELVDRAMERDQHPEEEAQTEAQGNFKNDVAKLLEAKLQDLQLSVENLVRRDRELDAMLLNSFQTAQAESSSTAEEDRLEQSARDIVSSARHCSGVSEQLRRKMREEEELDERLTYSFDRIDRLLARLLANHNTDDHSEGAPTASDDDVSSEVDRVDQSLEAAEKQVTNEDAPHGSMVVETDLEKEAQNVIEDKPTDKAAAASEDEVTAQTETSESDTTSSYTRRKSGQEADEAHTPEIPEKELVGMTLTIRNKVNGEYVTRPENLSHQDNWE
ncbi:hypothetical protein LTS18_014675, partial [Coniosporium uncinatum]